MDIGSLTSIETRKIRATSLACCSTVISGVAPAPDEYPHSP